MDDKADREYSRAPEIEDLIRLCRALNEQSVKYILVGGFAVVLHGFVRGTKDIDLLIDPSSENINKIKKALSYLPDNAISLVSHDDIQKYIVVRVADEFVVDLMGAACGIEYSAACNSIDFMTLHKDVKVPVANKELLIKTKDTLRPSDMMDVEFLRLSLDREKNKY